MSILCITTLGGFLAGFVICYWLLKTRVEMVREKGSFLVLKLPVMGEIRTKCRLSYSGLFIDEWGEFKEKLDKLGRLMDPEVIFRYAKTYRINYVGTEGDEGDKTWSQGRLAYTTLSKGAEGGYNIFLNPCLDVDKISEYLSKQLGEEIPPAEVQTFLFLHEIGHSPKSGNRSYFTELINHSLAGGKRSAVKRRELRLKKQEIELFSDQFALRELKKLRAGKTRPAESGNTPP